MAETDARYLDRLEQLATVGIVDVDHREAGLLRNAAAVTRCLQAVPGDVMVLLETTAGTGTALGATFEELAALREAIGAEKAGVAVTDDAVWVTNYEANTVSRSQGHSVRRSISSTSTPAATSFSVACVA